MKEKEQGFVQSGEGSDLNGVTESEHLSVGERD